MKGRRAAGGAPSKEGTNREGRTRASFAGVVQLPDAEGGRRMWIRTEVTGRAGRAVLWRVELARQVVMLERRCDKQDGVECDAQYG